MKFMVTDFRVLQDTIPRVVVKIRTDTGREGGVEIDVHRYPDLVRALQQNIGVELNTTHVPGWDALVAQVHDIAGEKVELLGLAKLVGGPADGARIPLAMFKSWAPFLVVEGNRYDRIEGTQTFVFAGRGNP